MTMECWIERERATAAIRELHAIERIRDAIGTAESHLDEIDAGVWMSVELNALLDAIRADIHLMLDQLADHQMRVSDDLCALSPEAVRLIAERLTQPE